MTDLSVMEALSLVAMDEERGMVAIGFALVCDSVAIPHLAAGADTDNGAEDQS